MLAAVNCATLLAAELLRAMVLVLPRVADKLLISRMAVEEALGVTEMAPLVLKALTALATILPELMVVPPV